MPLGTKDISIKEGDLVKVTALKRGANTHVRRGTIAAISSIVPGETRKYQLEGHLALYFNESEIELVAYVRR